MGLALEQIADVLCEDEQPLTADERADMLGLVERMQMDDRSQRRSRSAPHAEATAPSSPGAPPAA